MDKQSISQTLSKDERLALLSAIDKQIKPELDLAKAEARQELLDSYKDTGSDRRAIRVGGQKVGEVGISYSKAAPIILQDQMPKALDTLRTLGLTEEVPAKGWETHFTRAGDKVICTDTGEFVDWAIWQPSTIKTAAVRGCKPEDVRDAFQDRLASLNVRALLEGGSDE